MHRGKEEKLSRYIPAWQQLLCQPRGAAAGTVSCTLGCAESWGRKDLGNEGEPPSKACLIGSATCALVFRPGINLQTCLHYYKQSNEHGDKTAVTCFRGSNCQTFHQAEEICYAVFQASLTSRPSKEDLGANSRWLEGKQDFSLSAKTLRCLAVSTQPTSRVLTFQFLPEKMITSSKCNWQHQQPEETEVMFTWCREHALAGGLDSMISKGPFQPLWFCTIPHSRSESELSAKDTKNW